MPPTRQRAPRPRPSFALERPTRPPPSHAVVTNDPGRPDRGNAVAVRRGQARPLRRLLVSRSAPFRSRQISSRMAFARLMTASSVLSRNNIASACGQQATGVSGPGLYRYAMQAPSEIMRGRRILPSAGPGDGAAPAVSASAARVPCPQWPTIFFARHIRPGCPPRLAHERFPSSRRWARGARYEFDFDSGSAQRAFRLCACKLFLLACNSGGGSCAGAAFRNRIAKSGLWRSFRNLRYGRMSYGQPNRLPDREKPRRRRSERRV
jgi:hypothetical protein